MADRPAPSAELSHLEPISISRIGARAECETKWFLRYRLQEKPPADAHYFLIGTLIHECIEDYYNGLNDSPKKAAQSKIIDEFTKRGVPRPQVIQAIAAAKSEKDLLARFRNGEILNPKGEPYSAPRMTKVWKQEAAALGLDRAQRELADVVVPGINLPEGGLIAMVSRVLDLIDRYEDKLLIKREWLEEIKPELGFDFVIEGVRFLGFMDLVAKVKPEHRSKFGGKSWILVDYKTSKAKDLEVHAAAAHQSLQLSLYHHVITQELKLCGPNDLYMALHYLDATFAAETTRQPSDIDILISAAKHYQSLPDSPGLVKRLFYDGNCGTCELRDACIKHFGHPTSACATSTVNTVNEEHDWSF